MKLTKLPIADLENYNRFHSLNEKFQELIKGTDNKIEAEIKKRISALGVGINDIEFIKRNFEFIEKEGDDFKHLFYRAENKFIISIQKVPTISFNYDDEDFLNNQVTCTCEFKYY